MKISFTPNVSASSKQTKPLLRFSGMEFASQATDESIRVEASTVPGSDFTEVCEQLQALIPRKPCAVHQCCSRAELYYLSEESAWVAYARRWKSMWNDRRSLLPSKQYCSDMLQICSTLITYCEMGLQSDRIRYLSLAAIGAITALLIDWILVARVMVASGSSPLGTAQLKIVQELGSISQAKIIEYLKLIKVCYPYCPNDSPESECRLRRKQTVGHIDFILKNHHSNWNGFHAYIQQLENDDLDDGEITRWCNSNGFDLSTDN